MADSIESFGQLAVVPPVEVIKRNEVKRSLEVPEMSQASFLTCLEECATQVADTFSGQVHYFILISIITTALRALVFLV